MLLTGCHYLNHLKMGKTIILNPKRYIIIAGCYRSGTTALFNIVRLLMKHTKQDYGAYFWEGKTMGNSQYHIIKTHTYSPTFGKTAYRIYVAHRKLMEVRKSMNALKKVVIHTDYANASNTQNLKFAYGDAQLWASKADYIQNFSTLIKDPVMIMISILNDLEIPYTPGILQATIKEFGELRAPKAGHDKESLLTETHRKFQ